MSIIGRILSRMVSCDHGFELWHLTLCSMTEIERVNHAINTQDCLKRLDYSWQWANPSCCYDVTVRGKAKALHEHCNHCCEIRVQSVSVRCCAWPLCRRQQLLAVVNSSGDVGGGSTPALCCCWVGATSSVFATGHAAGVVQLWSLPPDTSNAGVWRLQGGLC